MARIVVRARVSAIVAVVGALGTCALASAAPASAAVPRTRTLLVVAGQSNALGQGSYAVDPVTGTDYLAAPYVNKADSLDRIAWQSWPVAAQAPAPVPLDTPQLLPLNGTTVQIFGPEIGLARQLAADRHGPVTIVKVGWAATSLAVSWDPATASDVYQRMLSLVQSLVAQDAQAGTVDRVKGFFWFQGVSDAGNASWYSTYQQNLATMFAALRADLHMPTAPIVIAKESLASTIQNLQAAGKCGTGACDALQAGDSAVRAADDWATTNLRHVAEVDTLGMPRTNNGVHLTNTSQLTLGEQMAKAWEAVTRHRAVLPPAG